MNARSCIAGLVACLIGTGAPVIRAEATAPRALFNGKNLDGFTTWLRASKERDPKGVFSVANGAIRISGGGFGYLATRERFRNCHLKLEYRWGDQKDLQRGPRTGKALDSGVFLHATGPDGNSADGAGAYMAAIECNVFEGATGDILLIRGTAADGSEIAPSVRATVSGAKDAEKFSFWSPKGKPITLQRWGRVSWRDKSREWKDVRGFRGPKDVEKPVGQWNTLECRCLDRTITVILNGKTVNEVTAVVPSEGKILLQCEGAEIFYRNITLQRLKPKR